MAAAIWADIGFPTLAAVAASPVEGITICGLTEKSRTNPVAPPALDPVVPPRVSCVPPPATFVTCQRPFAPVLTRCPVTSTKSPIPVRAAVFRFTTIGLVAVDETIVY
jgi:hypothetical protein